MLWAFCTQDEGWQRLPGNRSQGSKMTPKMHISERNGKKGEEVQPALKLKNNGGQTSSTFLNSQSEICIVGVILDPWLLSPGSLCQPSSWVQNAHNIMPDARISKTSWFVISCQTLMNKSTKVSNVTATETNKCNQQTHDKWGTMGSGR